MPHLPEDKKRTIARLRRIRGQSESLERAVEAGMECRDLLQQIAALRGAANGLMADVLESHMQEVFGSARSQLPDRPLPDADKEIESLMKTLRSYLK